MTQPTIVSLLVEGDLPGFGGSKQRVVVDTARVLIIDDLLPLMAPQLFNAETEEMISVQGENIALQYFDALQRRYLPLEDPSQLRDKLKVKLVSISHSLHSDPSPAREPSTEVSAHQQHLSGVSETTQSPERARREERAAIEVVGMVVAQLAQFTYGDTPLTPHNVDNIIAAVKAKHGLLRLETTLIAELRSEVAAAYVVGKERQRPHALENEVNKMRELHAEQEKGIAALVGTNRDLDAAASALQVENKHLQEQIAQLKATIRREAPRTPERDAPVDATSVTPSMPPVPPPTPATDRAQGPVLSNSFGLPPSSMEAGTTATPPTSGEPTPTAAPISTATSPPPAQSKSDLSVSSSAPVYTTTYAKTPPRRPDSAARSRKAEEPKPAAPQVVSRADPTVVTETAQAQSHMVSCFYNSYDPARRMTVKMGKAIVLNGASPYHTQLLTAVKAAFKRDDLIVGYTHSDGVMVIIESEETLKAYLELAAKNGVHRPILQCFDSENGPLPPLPPHPYNSYPSAGDSPQNSPPRAGSAMGSRPGSATPSRPASSRPASAMSTHTLSSFPIETSSGSYLDDNEMRWQFGQVSRDNVHASKSDVLRYVQLRYDDMGDTKRFHRLLSKFKNENLSFDEFCIVLLRLAAG